MRGFSRIQVIFVACFTLVAAHAAAINPSAEAAPHRSHLRSAAPASSVAATEARLLATLRASNETAVILGNLSRASSLTADVKKLAQMMIYHHSSNNLQVRKLGKQLNLSLQPSRTTAELQTDLYAKQTLSDLRRVNGIPFDRAFLKAVIQIHIHDIIALQALKEQLPSSSRVFTLVDEVLPTLFAHLDHARAVQKEHFPEDVE